MKFNVLPLAQINEVKDYPYGRLRTSAFFSVEFQPKKGFRSVFQTINPKNSRVNAPKKGTYSNFEFCYLKDNGHVTWGCYRLESFETINNFARFMADHAEALQPTGEQIKYLCAQAFQVAKISAGFEAHDLKAMMELLDPAITQLVIGMKNASPDWGKVVIPVAEINALPPKEAAIRYEIVASEPVNIFDM